MRRRRHTVAEIVQRVNLSLSQQKRYSNGGFAAALVPRVIVSRG